MDNHLESFNSSLGKIPLIKIFAASFIISSIAGLARLLRSYPADKPIPARLYFAAILNSGITGLVIALLWYHMYSDNLTFLIGISTLAGIGGISITDFIVLLIKKKIGIKVEIKNNTQDGGSES